MKKPQRLAALAAGAAITLAIGAATAQVATARAAALAAPALTLYASPDGTGTACSFGAPCGISVAKAAVEQQAGHMTGDIDVDLFGGTYHVPGGLQLGPADSGSGGHNVVWQAAPGQGQAVISGADRVAGFTSYDKTLNIWRAPLSQAEAQAGGQQLFVNGQRAQLAQSAGSPPGVQVTSTGFSTTDPAYASFTHQSQIEVVDNSDWKHVSCPVQSITPAATGGSDINILPSCWNANNQNVPNLGFPYNGSGLPAMSSISYIENAYQLLTQPGQFYVDQTGRYLYYIPRPGQDMGTADVELPVDQNLLTARGTPGHLAPVNQSDSDATYNGTSWGTYTNRNLGDLGNDVAATTNNGDSVSYTFTGTGLEILGETNSDEGTFNVYVDGTQDTSQSFTENTSGNTRLAQQVIYEASGLSQGTHTVEITKTGGTYLTIDGFEVIPDALNPVKNVAFDNITFEYSTWNLPETAGYIDNQAGILWNTDGAVPAPAMVPGAVTVSRGDGITFGNDTFEHLGATAVALVDGTQNSGVYDSVITDTAGGGVSVGTVDDYFQTDTRLMTTGDTIAGTRISYVGQDYSETVGIWAGYTRGLTVTHNDIGHTPYSGMSIGWGWGYASPCSMQSAQGLSNCAHGTDYAGGNTITDNYVHDVMNTLYDGGPIYTNGGQGGDIQNGAPVGSVLAGNYVSVANHTNNMLYQDEGSSYWHTYDNVVNFAAGASWIGMWTPTINNITIGPDNYSSTTNVNNNGTAISYTAPTIAANGAWPAAAQAIMNAAGPPQVNQTTYGDDSQALSYTGEWSAQGTPSGQTDTHTTTQQGSAVSLNFTGRSIAFVADEGPGGGTATVTLDGKQAGTIDTHAAFSDPDQTVFTDTSLDPGSHTITVTFTGTSGGGLTVGEFQAPPTPYLHVTTSDPYPAAGAGLTVTATVGNPGPPALPGETVTLLAPPGWSTSGPVALGTVEPGGTGTATFTVTPPSSQQAPGTFTFTAVATTVSGASAPLVGTTQAETPYGSLAAAFDDAGVSADTNTGAANLDGSGYSLSAAALASAGVTAGSAITAGGLTFNWPSAAAGSADNVVASGQEVTMNRSGTELGFLDTATYGSAAAEGTIIYADGSTQSFTLSVPDWYDGPPAGSSAAITMAYRNAPGNGQDNHPVYVYEQSVTLDSSSPVAAVVLPDASQGLAAGTSALHVFAMTVG